MKQSKTKIKRGNSIFRIKIPDDLYLFTWTPTHGQLLSAFSDKHILELCHLCIISTVCVVLLLAVNNDHRYFRETQPLPGKRQQHNSESAL